MQKASLLIFLLMGSNAVASDWLTAPSFYTHDPYTGMRTNQYNSPPPAVVAQGGNYQASGYRHFRSTLQYGPSADNYHRVEQWGPPVRPYEEWRFPYRPYSVPYDQWGAPLAGLNIGNAVPWYQGPGIPPQNYPVGPNPNNPPNSGMGPFPGVGQPWQPNVPYPSGPGQAYPAPPYADGYYPNYDAIPRLNDQQFYSKPTQ